MALVEFAGISHAWFIEGQAGGAAIEQLFENAQVVRFEADYTIMMDSRQTGTDVPGTRWPTRAGLALAGFFGGLLYLYFLVGFVGLWMRTGLIGLLSYVFYHPHAAWLTGGAYTGATLLLVLLFMRQLLAISENVRLNQDLQKSAAQLEDTKRAIIKFL